MRKLISVLGVLSVLATASTVHATAISQEQMNQELEAKRRHESEHTEDFAAKFYPPKKDSKLVCPPSGLSLSWPLGGTAYKNWMVFNYVDLDTTTGVKDYMGYTGANAQTYDGHRGLDIDVPSFRYMDNDTPVIASAAGTVTEIYQASYDRNTSCSTDQWNHVTLKHANGFQTIYGHMKKNSVVVTVGQTVTAGQKLGVVGSSGCSTGPHVHLETIDCNNKLIEPMKEGMFLSPPIYTKNAPTTIMDTNIKQPTISSYTELQDPGLTEPTSVHAGVNFSVAMIVSSLKVNDVLAIDVYDPSNTLQSFGYSNTSSSYYAFSYWWSNFYLNTLGTWTFKYKVNGTVQVTRTITVVP